MSKSGPWPWRVLWSTVKALTEICLYPSQELLPLAFLCSHPPLNSANLSLSQGMWSFQAGLNSYDYGNKNIRNVPQSPSFSHKLHVRFSSTQGDNIPTFVVKCREMTLDVVIWVILDK